MLSFSSCKVPVFLARQSVARRPHHVPIHGPRPRLRPKLVGPRFTYDLGSQRAAAHAPRAQRSNYDPVYSGFGALFDRPRLHIASGDRTRADTASDCQTNTLVSELSLYSQPGRRHKSRSDSLGRSNSHAYASGDRTHSRMPRDAHNIMMVVVEGSNDHQVSTSCYGASFSVH